MKAKDLAEQLLKNPDFDVVIDYCEFYDHAYAEIVTCSINGIEDIDYTYNQICLSYEEVARL